MNINSFYQFGSRYNASAFMDYAAITKYPGEIDRSLLVGRYRDIDFPVVFKQSLGNKFHDLMGTGWVSLFLISAKMRNAFQEDGLTGWQTFEVKVLDRKGNEVPGYYGLSVTGRCGPVDYDKCQVIEKRAVPGGALGKIYIGSYIGLDEWDGSDFFIPEDTIGINITQKAFDVIKKNKLTNVDLHNLAEIEIAEFALPLWYREKMNIK